MKAFPQELLERLPLLRWEPFSTENPVAQAFAVLPTPKGVNRYFKGRTPLGWLCLELCYSVAPTQNVLAWIDFLLTHGADPLLPLTKPRLQSLSGKHFGPVLLCQAILMSRNENLLQIANKHEIELIVQPPPSVPWSHRTSFTDITAWHNPQWLVDYAKNAPPWERSDLLGRVVDAWKEKPDLCLEGVDVLRAQGLKWKVSDAPKLWFLALTDNGPNHLQWFKWAEDLGLEGLHESSGIRAVEFQVLIGRALLYHAPSVRNMTRIRERLNLMVPAYLRSALAPKLPDIDKGFFLTPVHWEGVLRIVQWATDWQVPTASRTPNGVPWTLWVLQNVHESCESAIYIHEKEDCEVVAWECLQTLVKAGHRPTLRTKERIKGGASAISKSSFSDAMRSPFLLSWSLGKWPEKFERLRREVAFEEKLNKRLQGSETKITPSRPIRRL